jgi:hypothetical protein
MGNLKGAMKMLSVETIEGLKNNLATFFQMMQSVDPLLKISQKNYDALRRWNHKRGITDEMLAGLGGEQILAAAYVSAKAEGLLEFEPNAEERAEQERKRIVELNRRDREAGSHTANAPWRTATESPAESAVRLTKEAGGEFAERAISNADAIKAEQAKEAAESDLSCVPSLKSIIEANGAEIPVAEQKAMSRIQHREYCRRLSNARMQLIAARKKR